ncbi:hypothetical protein [Leptospira kirschneri]|uniref:hypothetical protein n=1 Tax=Leptospira kirschneri TaxID=29507 RepID=UPI003569C102
MAKPTITIEEVKEDGIKKVQIYISKPEGTDVLLHLEPQDFRSLEKEILRLNDYENAEEFEEDDDDV